MQAALPTPREEACECPVTGKSQLTRRFSTIILALSTISYIAAAPLSALSCDCAQVKIPATNPSEVDAQAGYKWSLTPESQTEFHDAVEQAKTFCDDYKKKHPDEKLAIVSDIDETVLDNRPALKEFTHENWAKFFQWVQEAKAPKLKESADFLQWARDKGYFIFFITGRHERDRPATIVNLNRQGFNYDGLYLRVEGDKRPAEQYKTEIREQIEKMGFVVVENVGDQFSDLAGGHSVDCAKLPNKMYFIP